MSEILVPKDKASLINILLENCSSFDHIYIVFCEHIDYAKGLQDKKELDWFCNNRCEIHSKIRTDVLLCLPKSCKKLLSEVAK